MSQKKLSQSFRPHGSRARPAGTFTNCSGGMNILLLLIHHPLQCRLREEFMGLPWGVTLNYFCNILSLDKREHRVRNRRSGGHLLLIRVVYVALLPSHPDAMPWIIDRHKIVMFPGIYIWHNSQKSCWLETYLPLMSQKNTSDFLRLSTRNFDQNFISGNWDGWNWGGGGDPISGRCISRFPCTIIHVNSLYELTWMFVQPMEFSGVCPIRYSLNSSVSDKRTVCPVHHTCTHSW